MDDTRLRRVQLGIRLAEVDGMLGALQRLPQGQPLVSTGLTPLLYGWEGWQVVQVRSLSLSCLSRLIFATRAISIPLLAINSEEYATGDEFTKLFAMVPSAEIHEIYVICGYLQPCRSGNIE